MLILPDDIPAHPHTVAIDAAMQAPKADASVFPWNKSQAAAPLAVRLIHAFPRAHRPASA